MSCDSTIHGWITVTISPLMFLESSIMPNTKNPSDNLSASKGSSGSLSPLRSASSLTSRSNFNSFDSIPSQNTRKSGSLRSSSSRDISVSPTNTQYFDPNSQRLLCPVCNISMANLTDLNRHVDIEHMEKTKPTPSSPYFSDSEEDVSDTIINWFKSAHQKVFVPLSKKTPNLQQLQKLASGNHPDVVFQTHHLQENDNSKPISLSDSQNEQSTRYTAHFKNLNSASRCANGGCGKNLGILTGKINCRKCGEVFCEDHCSLQMRLDHRARHDSKDGLWGRVCQSCFATKAGFFEDGNVKSRDLFKAFAAARSKVMDRRQLETNRIISRLERIACSPGGPSGASAKAVVNWQPDEEAIACPHCKKQFRPLTRRKHHCRLCGLVVCGETSCTTKASLAGLLKEGPSIFDPKVSILVCVECIALVKRRRGTKTDAEPLVATIHTQLKIYQELILRHLPSFNKYIITIKEKEAIAPHDEDVRAALSLRQTLLEAFSKYDALRQRLLTSKAPNALQARLVSSIGASCVQFLQTNTVSLSALPRLINSPSKPKAPEPTVIKLDPAQMLIEQQVSVFQEQIENLRSLLADATTLRRLDDVKALNISIQELAQEIEALRSQRQ